MKTNLKLKKTMGRLLTHLGILVFLVLNLAPLIIAFSSSLRTPGNSTSPLQLFIELSGKSYAIAFDKMHYLNAIKNSLLYTGIAVVCVVILAGMAAYPLARMKTRLSKFLYLFFLAGLVVPGQLNIIPVFQTFQSLHMSGTQLSPILMFITCSLPFSTFLYTGFIRTSVPEELEEAAYLDGAGLLGRYWRIVFPLLIPATVSVVITQAVWIWNDFFFYMIFITKSKLAPLPLAMLGFMGDRINPTQWNILFAACFLCAFPLVLAFAFLQRYFMSGLTVGAVKG